MDLREKLTPAILAYDGIQYAYMAGIHAEEPEQLKAFNWSGYRFDAGRSSDWEYIFLRTKVPGKGESGGGQDQNYKCG